MPSQCSAPWPSLSSRARQLEVRLTLNRCLKVRLAREGRQLPVDVTDTAHPKLQFGLILARVLWRALRAGDPGMIKAARRLAVALTLTIVGPRYRPGRGSALPLSGE